MPIRPALRVPGRRTPSIRPIVGTGAAGILLAAWLVAACTPSTNPVEFVSPANGTHDVARFPVISVVYQNALPDNSTTLAKWVKLYDRAGTQVPLLVRRSDADTRVAVATVATTEDRLLPASDYVLEVHPGKIAPEAAGRVWFRTGGAKSVFCIDRDDAADPWGSTCDENYWREDLGLGACGLTNPLADGSCTCAIDPQTPVLGGHKATCDCMEENDTSGILATLADHAVVTDASPAPGSQVAAGPISIVATVDRDLGASASLYGFRLEEVSDGGQPSSFTADLPASWNASTRTLSLSGLALGANARYRMTLMLDGTTEPTGVAVAGPQPHAFSWTFNTWEGPSGQLERVVPTARTQGIDFPTHLPLQPHLRFVFDGPLPAGVADADGPALVVKIVGGNAVHQRVTWYDLDMHRLHLMVYGGLDEGTRYEVFCSTDFATAIGDAGCETTPIARFLTQVTPPERGIDPALGPGHEIFVGTWAEWEAAHSGKRLLPVRPGVLHAPYGVKERYLTDAAGPTAFFGHVLLVPPEPATAPVATLRVDPADPGCLDLPVPPERHLGRFVASDTDCIVGGCGDGYVCETCPGSGNAACPAGADRCRWSLQDWREGLLDYCVALVDGGEVACNADDAYRCAGGGNEGLAPFAKSRMGASVESECPTGYKLDSPNNCVPAGRVDLDLAPGEHYFAIESAQGSASHWDPVSQDFEPGAPAVLLQSEDPEAPATLVATVPLPGGGIDIPTDACRTLGNPGDAIDCFDSLGACDTTTGTCIAVQQNMGEAQEAVGAPAESCGTCFDGFVCHATLGRCVVDGSDPAFDCSGAGCRADWVQVDATANVWRIWWPQRASSSGSRRFNATARIWNPASQVFEPLTQLSTTSPYYDTCDTATDVGTCVLDLCNDWNDDTYEEQVAKQVAALAAHPAERIGYFAAGYHTLKGGVEGIQYDDGNVTPPACTDTLKIFTTASSSYQDMDGPIGFFVKLPAGETPGTNEIQVSDVHQLGRLVSPGPLEIRGLRFDGFADPLYVTGGSGLLIHGSQFVDATASKALYSGDGNTTSGPVTFEGNLLAGTGSIDQRSSQSVEYVTRNNLFWKVQKKAHTSQYNGSIDTPVACTSGADCVKPLCRVDHDCRIPFLAGSGSFDGANPDLDGTHPTCDAIDGTTEIGTCSHGVVGQGLFMDNVMLDGEGPNNGPWYLFRMQRNHFENVAGQEAFDGEGGSAFVSILDNRIYHSQTNLVTMLVEDVPGAGAGGVNLLRAIAIEGNRVLRTGPVGRFVNGRTGRPYLADASGAVLSMRPGADSVGLDSAGLRMVGNTFTDVPASREWGNGGSAGGSIWNTEEIRFLENTLLSDTGMAMNFLTGSGLPLVSGTAEGNLAFSTTREHYEENLCGASVTLEDLRVGSVGDFSLCANASPRPTMGALDSTPGCEHQYVPLLEARHHMLHEPVADTPVLDYESFQRELVPDLESLWEHYRSWPGYDPALEDDVLAVRSGHAACGHGADTGSCTDEDPDGDLYRGAGDNCPDDANWDQADTDSDGIGDVCDGS